MIQLENFCKISTHTFYSRKTLKSRHLIIHKMNPQELFLQYIKIFVIHYRNNSVNVTKSLSTINYLLKIIWFALYVTFVFRFKLTGRNNENKIYH